MVSMTNNINSRIRPGKINANATAAKIVAIPLPGRKSIVIKNNGSVPIYLGEDDVDSNDYPLGAGEKEGYDIGPAVNIYVRTASGTCDVRFLEGA